MATTYIEFTPGSAAFPATNFPGPTVLQGTNFAVPALAYDAATAESAYFFFRVLGYGSGNFSVDVDWYADTATSGNIVWGSSIACITPDTDTQDIETKAFGTVATVTDSHLGTTGQRLHRATVAVSSLDSITVGDWCCLRVYRDAANGADTMTGDSLLTKVTISYSDT